MYRRWMKKRMMRKKITFSTLFVWIRDGIQLTWTVQYVRSNCSEDTKSVYCVEIRSLDLIKKSRNHANQRLRVRAVVTHVWLRLRESLSLLRSFEEVSGVKRSVVLHGGVWRVIDAKRYDDQNKKYGGCKISSEFKIQKQSDITCAWDEMYHIIWWF